MLRRLRSDISIGNASTVSMDSNYSAPLVQPGDMHPETGLDTSTSDVQASAAALWGSSDDPASLGMQIASGRMLHRRGLDRRSLCPDLPEPQGSPQLDSDSQSGYVIGHCVIV